MIYLLTMVIALAIASVVITACLNWYGNKKSLLRKNFVEQSKTLGEAEKALRSIASGTSGNPVLEAQIGLDEVNSYHNNRKEIS